MTTPTSTARFTSATTELGELTLLATDTALTGVYFPGHWYPPTAAAMGDRVPLADDPVFTAVADQLRDYLAGARTTFDLQISLQGDDFSQQVWRLIDAVPYGHTRSYGELATELGNPALAQRVGQAVGHNPISIIVPCHRIVGADGSLTGYAGGLERKRRLLDLEADDSERLF